MEVLNKRTRNDGVKTWLWGSVHSIKLERSANSPGTLSQIREGWQALAREASFFLPIGLVGL